MGRSGLRFRGGRCLPLEGARYSEQETAASADEQACTAKQQGRRIAAELPSVEKYQQEAGDDCHAQPDRPILSTKSKLTGFVVVALGNCCHPAPPSLKPSGLALPNFLHP